MRFHSALVLVVGSLICPNVGFGADDLSLTDALERASRVSPEMVSAREALAAARGRELQAAAFPNPSLEYEHEETSRGDVETSEDVIALAQPVELAGQRGLRREAAELRRAAEEARLLEAETKLAFEVRRAYAVAIATEARAGAATEAAREFETGRGVIQKRYAQGDASGYARRRLELEAARFAGLEAEAIGANLAARAALVALVDGEEAFARNDRYTLSDPLGVAELSATEAELRQLALDRRPDLRALELDRRATEVELRLGKRDRIPTPVLVGGYKTERGEDEVDSLRTHGFVVGVSLPVPLWDRREGAIAALGAEARRRGAEVTRARLRVLRELEQTRSRFEAAAAQLAAIRPYLGNEGAVAVRAARAAYTEGEISLLEWLDAVRAYYEARTTFATVKTNYFVERAALERVTGGPLP